MRRDGGTPFNASMSKLWRLVLVVAATAALAPGAATAADWQTANVGGYTAATTTAAKFTIGATTITCNTATAGGNVAVSPAPGTNPWNAFATFTPILANCATGLGVAVNVMCAAGTLGTGMAPGAYGGPALPPANGGLSGLTLTGFSCTLNMAGVNCSTVTGTINSTHRNPTPPLVGEISFSAIGQALNAAKIGAGCGAIPNGATTFTNPMGGGLLYKYTNPVAAANQAYLWYG